MILYLFTSFVSFLFLFFTYHIHLFLSFSYRHIISLSCGSNDSAKSTFAELIFHMVLIKIICRLQKLDTRIHS